MNHPRILGIRTANQRDFHFGHNNIIRYCNRPFRSLDEMDQTILERLNASVKANDTLHFLGDFCIGSNGAGSGAPQTDSLQEVLCARRQSRQRSPQVDRRVFLAQQPCRNLNTWPTDRALSLCHAGLESVTSRIVASLRAFTWATPGGRPVTLTSKEVKLLAFLIRNPRRMISRDELLNEVWGYENYPSTRTVDNHIFRMFAHRNVRNPELKPPCVRHMGAIAES